MFFSFKRNKASVDKNKQDKVVEQSSDSTPKLSFFSKIKKLLSGNQALDNEVFDHLEEELIIADIGLDTSEKLIQKLKKRAKKENISDVAGLVPMLKEEIIRLMNIQDKPLETTLSLQGKQLPYTIVMVGVNGVGKTTSLGKLAHLYRQQKHSVVIGAGDTFRAAAIEQAEVWAQRTGARCVSQKNNASPSSVAFDTLASAKSKGDEIVLLDTAGRLHNKSDLMQELAKINRVIQKINPEAPHEVLLVIDATSGQNAVEQCKQFKEIIGVTGLILTKFDGTAKGGVVINICAQFQIPIKYIGTGEKAEDLKEFDYEYFINKIFEDS